MTFLNGFLIAAIVWAVIWASKAVDRMLTVIFFMHVVYMFTPVPPLLPLGFTNIASEEVMISMMAGQIFRHAGLEWKKFVPKWWLIGLTGFTLMYLLSIGRGVFLVSRLNEVFSVARAPVMLITVLWYCTIVVPIKGNEKKILQVISVFCVILTVIAAGRLAGVIPIVVALSGEYETIVKRVLPWGSAMFLSSMIYLIYIQALARSGFEWMKWWVPVGPILVIVLQHRSVWTSTISSLGVMLLTVRQNSNKVIAYCLTLVFLGALFFVALPDSKLARSLSASADRAVEQKDTVQDRYSSWSSILNIGFMKEDINFLIGRPMGSSNVRWVRHKRVAFAAHNHYVTIISWSGGYGLFFAIIMLLPLPFALLKIQDLRKIWGVIAVGQLVFWISYSPDPLNMVVLGLCVSALIKHRQEVTDDALEAEYSNLRSLKGKPALGA